MIVRKGCFAQEWIEKSVASLVNYARLTRGVREAIIKSTKEKFLSESLFFFLFCIIRYLNYPIKCMKKIMGGDETRP